MSFLKQHLSYLPWGPTGSDEDSESCSVIDPEEDREEEEATKMRKKAGIPELTADSLPSTLVQKMLILGFFHLLLTTLRFEVNCKSYLAG